MNRISTAAETYLLTAVSVVLTLTACHSYALKSRQEGCRAPSRTPLAQRSPTRHRSSRTSVDWNKKVVTDKDGGYRIVALPPGQYSLTANRTRV